MPAKTLSESEAFNLMEKSGMSADSLAFFKGGGRGPVPPSRGSARLRRKFTESKMGKGLMAKAQSSAVPAQTSAATSPVAPAPAAPAVPIYRQRELPAEPFLGRSRRGLGLIRR